MYAEEIKKLYEMIPASVCDENCSKCCKDMIQFSPSEEENMGGYEWNGKCTHLRGGKCSVYDRRAFVCRLYGTSELFRCEGCTPERYLSESETMELLRLYNKYRNAEIAQKTIKKE